MLACCTGSLRLGYACALFYIKNVLLLGVQMTQKDMCMSDTIPGYKHPNGGGGGRLTPVRTSAAGSALVKHRWDKVRAAHLQGALEGLADVVPEGELPDHYETSAETVAHVIARSQSSRSYLDADTRAARYVAAGAGQPGFGQQQQQQEQPQQGLTLSVSTEALLALADRLGALPDRTDVLEHDRDAPE